MSRITVKTGAGLRMAALCGVILACSDGTGPSSRRSPEPAAIAIATQEVHVARRDTLRMQATVLDGQNQPVAGRTVRWSSADPGIATVTIDGLVRGVAAGSTVLTASAGQVTATASVNVTDLLGVDVRFADDTPDGVRSRIAALHTVGHTAAPGTMLLTRGRRDDLILAVDAAGGPLLLGFAGDSVATLGIRATVNTLVHLLLTVPGVPDVADADAASAIDADPETARLTSDLEAVLVSGGVVTGWTDGPAELAALAGRVAAAVLALPTQPEPPAGGLPLNGVAPYVSITDDGDAAPHFLVANQGAIAFAVRTAALGATPPIDSILAGPGESLTLRAESGRIRIDVQQNASSIDLNATLLGQHAAEAVLALVSGDAQLAGESDWPAHAGAAAVDDAVLDALRAGELEAAVARLFANLRTAAADIRTVLRAGDFEQEDGAAFAGLTGFAAGLGGEAGFLHDYVALYDHAGRGMSLRDSVVVCQPAMLVEECVGSVQLLPATLPVAVGRTGVLDAVVTGVDGTDLSGARALTWRSANSAVATVDASGRVTAVGTEGQSTTITAAEPLTGKTGSAQVVIGGIVHRIEIQPATADLHVGDTLALTVTAYDEGDRVLAGRTASWSVSSAGVLSIDSNGVLRALAAGTSTVTATVEGVTASITLSVVDPDDPPSPAGTYELVSYRGVAVGEVCGVGCAWSVDCPTCAMIIESGEAILTDDRWDFLIVARRKNESGGYNPALPIYESSGPLAFHARTRGPLTVPSEPWCTEQGLVAGQGYCTLLPSGWVYAFRLFLTYDPYMELSDDLTTVVSAIGGQTVWRRVTP